MSIEHIKHAGHGFHAAHKGIEEGGAKGVALAAAGTAMGTAATVGMIGLALTPLGWLVAAGIGAGAAIAKNR